MLNLGEKFEAFIEKAPAAVALRATLQRLLPAEKQYEKTLLFSTLMTLMFDVTLKSTTSLHKSYLKHKDSVPVSLAAVYQKTNNLEGAYFLIRHHGQLKKWVAEGERKHAGTTDTGEVFEQQISLTDAAGKKMYLRRITVQLFKKTRDGDKEIHILTNANKQQLSSVRASECYRERWDIEGMFLELTQSLSGTLGGVHGFEYVEQKLSWNILCSDTSSAWRGMEIAIVGAEWSRAIDDVTDCQFGKVLSVLCERLDFRRYPKSRRGPKKKVVKIFDPKVSHVSTAKILKERKMKNNDQTNETKKVP
jgi:hypothetical protein